MLDVDNSDGTTSTSTVVVDHGLVPSTDSVLFSQWEAKFYPVVRLAPAACLLTNCSVSTTGQVSLSLYLAGRENDKLVSSLLSPSWYHSVTHCEGLQACRLHHSPLVATTHYLQQDTKHLASSWLWAVWWCNNNYLTTQRSHLTLTTGTTTNHQTANWLHAKSPKLPIFHELLVLVASSEWARAFQCFNADLVVSQILDGSFQTSK